MSAPVLLQILHILAGLVVLAEALNKLERCHPLASGLSARERWVDAHKAAAWFLLALGAGGAVAAPLLLAGGVQAQQAAELLRLERPTLAEVLVLAGFAVLIIRTRVKEG
jgi:uncharacterized iron-regulated membrane protein